MSGERTRGEHPPCPSSFALQRHALCPEESDESTAEHVARCPRCHAVIAELQAEGRAYMSSPAAEALRRKLIAGEKAEATPVLTAPRFWAWGGGLAAVAALALLFSSAGKDRSAGPVGPVNPVGTASGQTDLLAPKGTAQLGLFAGDEGLARGELSESAVLKPGARLQPVFSAPRAGFVALVLLTPGGERIQLHPSNRHEGAPIEAGPLTPLGPSFRLDEETGSYRVTAYFSEAPFPTRRLSALGSDGQAPDFSGLVLSRGFEVQR